MAARGQGLQTIETRADDRKLDQAARQAGEIIKASADPAFTLARFLIMCADEVQTRRPVAPVTSRRRSA
jgi:hypothetical protein